MKKITLLGFMLCITSFLYSQSTQSNKIRFVYSECTEESKKELFDVLKGDKVAFKKVYTKYYDACKKGKVILSTKQYAPIKLKIDQANNNFEDKIYVERALNKYILVTDLIKK